MGAGLVNAMLANCLRPLHDAVAAEHRGPVTPDSEREILSAWEVMVGALEG